MTRDELLADINSPQFQGSRTLQTPYFALRALVELCNKWEAEGNYCLPIKDAIWAIEKELE